VKNKLKPMEIPKIFSFEQNMMSTLLNSPDFSGTVTPSNFPEVGLWFIDNSFLSKKRFPESDFRSWSKELLQIENPRVRSVGSVDCVSCHVSSNILNWQKTNFKNWDWNWIEKTEGFSHHKDLRNVTKRKLFSHHLRAFGYQDSTPQVSNRVINETAVVLDWLEGLKK
jgi:hypothetical protein